MLINMEQSQAALVEHLKRLERKQAELQRTNRRLGSVIGAIILVTGALVLMGQTSQPQTLEATEFVLRGRAIDEDSDFHYAIALAARNSVILRVIDVLMDLLRESRSRALQVPGRPKRSFDGHRRILRAIERRDAKAAEAAVRQHLGEIEEVVMRQI